MSMHMMREYIGAVVTHVENANRISRLTDVKVGFLSFKAVYGDSQLKRRFRVQ